MSKITIVRQQESELPAIVNIQFINKGADYQQGSQQAKRASVKSVQKVDVSSPIVIDDATAKNIAEKLLYNVWIERNRFTLDLPIKYAYLEPTDVFYVVDLAAKLKFGVRIVKRTEARNGKISLDCVSDFAPLYLQNAAATQALVTPQIPLVSSGTIAAFLDIAALSSVNTQTGFYIPMAGATDIWSGGTVYRSLDGGGTYTAVATTSAPSTIGVALNELADWPTPAITDNVSTLLVTLDSGSLSTTNDIGLANGANKLAVATTGNAGWEILQFRYAVLQPPQPGSTKDTYLLSGFLRGQNGTGWATSEHNAGNQVVLLDSSVAFIPISDAQIGQPLLYKVVTTGQTLAGVTAQTITYTGVALIPYASKNLGATNTSANWNFTWQPVFNTGESTTAPQTYDVEIYSDSAYTELERTFAGISTAAVTYTAAQQIDDIGGAMSEVYVKVYRLNATVGRGYSVSGAFLLDAGGQVLSTRPTTLTEAASASDSSDSVVS